MRDTLPDWTDALLDGGETLPVSVVDRIAALGDAARDGLLAVVDRRELWRVDARGAGLGPVHAVRLLGRLAPSPDAVELLLDVLAETDALDLLCDAAQLVLKDWGGEVVGAAVVARLRSAGADAARRNWMWTLSSSKWRSDEGLSVLLDHLRSGDSAAPTMLAEYGDPRALPEIHRQFQGYRLDGRPSLFANQAVLEFEDAVLSLGSELTPVEEALVAATHALRDAAIALAVQPRRRRPALRDRALFGDPSRPNELCGCGSGRKYKKCHRDEEEAPSDDSSLLLDD
jgi:hypothetical protein